MFFPETLVKIFWFSTKNLPLVAKVRPPNFINLQPWGPFLKRPGNLSGAKSNRWNYDPACREKLCSLYVSVIRKGKITPSFEACVLIEDSRGLMWPEKFRDVRNGPLMIKSSFLWTQWLSLCLTLALSS